MYQVMIVRIRLLSVLLMLAAASVPAQATQITIAGSCDAPAMCSFEFSGDTGDNGRLGWGEVVSFNLTSPDGTTFDTRVRGQWRPTGDFRAFTVGSGASRIRVDFTSFTGSTEAGGTGLFRLLHRVSGSFVPLQFGGNDVIGSYTVTAVPLPAAAWLFVTGLAGLFVRRRVGARSKSQILAGATA